MPSGRKGILHLVVPARRAGEFPGRNPPIGKPAGHTLPLLGGGAGRTRPGAFAEPRFAQIGESIWIKHELTHLYSRIRPSYNPETAQQPIPHTPIWLPPLYRGQASLAEHMGDQPRGSSSMPFSRRLAAHLIAAHDCRERRSHLNGSNASIGVVAARLRKGKESRLLCEPNWAVEESLPLPNFLLRPIFVSLPGDSG